MTIRLVTDSTCDLPAELAAQHQIYVVPINIQFGAVSYQENQTIGPAEFYRRIALDGLLPKTSQPSVGAFSAAYRSLADTATEILSIHVTAQLSGTYQSAVMAAAQLADRVKVTVIDSQAGSAGLGWMLHEAGQLIAAGRSVAQIQRHLEARRPQVSIFFAVDNLKFAQMSGRVGKLRTVLGTVLNIKPIIGLENGLIEVKDRVRSRKAARQRIITLTQNKVADRAVNLAVVHAQAPDQANRLLAQAGEQLNVRARFVKDVALSLAVHFGPGTLGLIAYPAD